MKALYTLEQLVNDHYKTLGVEPQESEKIETWNGYHGQITAPKGTFEKIYEDAESEDKE